MDSEVWARLSEWHNAWLDASPGDRERLQRTFLAEHPALEAEVRELVIAGPIVPGFLETSAFALALRDVADDDAPLASGTLVGPYQIVSLIAAGGMGQVYRATDVRLGRDVAIKLLSGADRHDRDLVERFLQEARITAALDRPNIVRLFDVGIHDDRPFLVMELLDGETLRERLGRGPLRADEIRRVALDAVHGLTAAHAAGLVHRDLKPENLFLTRSGPAKILDFGVAKLVQGSPVSGNQPATVAGMLVGTAGYLAPEQILGEAVDARADLFAFGAILYEMLTGRRAFGREHTIDTLYAVLREPVPSLRGEPGVASDMAAIADRLLEKDPDARFQSAADLAWVRTGEQQPLISGLTMAMDTLPLGNWTNRLLVLEHASGFVPPGPGGPAQFVSPGRLLRFDTPTSAPQVLVDTLVTPTSMDLDADSGDLFITEIRTGRIIKVALY